jgi:DNA-binding NarL/FixJ family response regulator
MIRVLVVDDHAILRDGIRSLLESQEDINVIGEASDGSEALELTGILHPDVVLMDISMPKMNGLEATRLIKASHPDVRVLILTQHDNREYITPALEAGASGYVLKRSGRREMLTAIRQVYEHGSFITSNIVQEILPSNQSVKYSGGLSGLHLTERERQVLKMIVDGKSNKEIALELGISPKTVSVHHTNLMTKLGVHNTVALIRFIANNPSINLSPAERENR